MASRDSTSLAFFRDPSRAPWDLPYRLVPSPAPAGPPAPQEATREPWPHRPVPSGAPGPGSSPAQQGGARREPAPGHSCGLGNAAKPAGVTAEIRSGIPGRGKGPNLPCCWRRRRHSHRGGRARARWARRAQPRPCGCAQLPSDTLALGPRTASQCWQKLQLCQVNDSKRKQQVSALYMTWGLNKNVNTRGILYFFCPMTYPGFQHSCLDQSCFKQKTSNAANTGVDRKETYKHSSLSAIESLPISCLCCRFILGKYHISC